MKKITAILAALCITASMTACGEQTTEITATEAETEETTAETEPEKPAFVQYANGVVAQLSGDILLNDTIRIVSRNEENKYEYYAYNMAEKKLTEISENIYNSGAFGSVLISHYEDDIYSFSNIETGEEIVKGKCCYSKQVGECWNNGRIAVIQTEESFSGNVTKVGVLNDKGEWVIPLTEINNICGAEIINDVLFVSCVDADDYCNAKIYSIPDNKLLFDLPASYANERSQLWFEEYGALDFLSCYENKIYLLNSSDIIEFDTSNNTFRDITEFGEYTESDAHGNELFAYRNGAYLFCNGSKYTVCDKSMTKLYEVDLSEYEEVGILKVTKERIAFRCKNPDGVSYNCVMNASGELEFEPIKTEEMYILHIDDNVLIYRVDGGVSFYNFSTKEFVNLHDNENYDGFEGYDPESGMIIVEAEDDNFYLVDINDAGTYINPFER